MIDRIQAALRAYGLQGWLFFDHHLRDPLAYRILQLPTNIEATRRWYYFVPAEGDPRKLVHKIESGMLDSLPGRKALYSRWTEQKTKLASMLDGTSPVAMQYSPQCAIPYIALVDAGTVELVRGLGIEVCSSANLVQEFEARLNRAQYESHKEAGKLVDQVRRQAFQLAGQRIRASDSLNEYQLQQFVLRRFSELNLQCDHGPIVAVNANASDPHYEPTVDKHSLIRSGDLLLLDMWAKLNQCEAIYYDITWTGFCGDVVPDQITNVFEIVRDARRAACELVQQSVSSGRNLAGWQVDDAARLSIERAGFGEYFFHRTGHSIGTEVHGNGANMDNFESHDERTILPDTCFSIEPGIYLPDFGIRSEVNVFVSHSSAEVTGEQQDKIIRV